jgi:hypothetical protein
MLRVGEGLDVEGNHNAGSHTTTHKYVALTTEQGPVLCIMIADIGAVILKPIRTRSSLISSKTCRWYVGEIFPFTGLNRPLGLQEVEVPRIYRKIAV